MFIYTEESATQKQTPWGIEVRHKLLDANLTQTKLIGELKSKGITLAKSQLNALLKGRGLRTQQEAIHAINQILGIPEE